MSGASDFTLFIGRLHPLLVHLPIGFIVILALLELLTRSPRFKQANANAGLILAVAVPTALFAVLCGWLLSSAGGYGENLLQWHKWTGVATGAMCLLAAILYRLDLKKAYRFCLVFTIIVLAVASHFGGSLTHGSDYLVRYAPPGLRRLLGGSPQPSSKPTANHSAPADFKQLPAFAGVIQPVFQQNCVGCHGPDKSKGKLRLDSLQAVLKGGQSGAAVVPGKAAESDLVKRLKLPVSSDDHMPPDGKPQPNADEIALVEWWVDAGAPADKKIAELKPPANIERVLATHFGAPAPVAKTVPPKPLNDVLPLTSSLADQLSIAVTPLSPKEPWLQANASVAGTNFGDADLEKLSSLGPNLRWLDLAGTSVTDEGAGRLAAMPNLVRLHLERTTITDAGLARLAPLQNLEYLNLYGTAITDVGLEQLRELPRLKQIYVWQTKVTSAAATNFAQAKVDKDQLQRWQDEIEQLKTKIKDARVVVDVGTTALATSSTNTAPVNTLCPVSGKPINAAKTVVHDGKVIAFCCDDCKAEFEKDPKPFLEKLASSLTNAPPAAKAQ